MKKRGFLIMALLFSLLSTVLFTACEPTSQTLRDPNNLRPSVSATIKQEFPLNIDLAAFNQSIQGSELREATGRVLYHSALKWDLEEICRKAGFSSDKLKQLEIQEITIKAQAPVDYNVGFFRKLSVFWESLWLYLPRVMMKKIKIKLLSYSSRRIYCLYSRAVVCP